MLAATGIAIFLIPTLFVMVEKLAHRGKAEESSWCGAGSETESGRRRALT